MGTKLRFLISIAILLNFGIIQLNMASEKLSAIVSQFSAKFVNELEKDKSVVSSPLSAEILLALLTLSCTEPSHKELLGALNIVDDNEVRSSFSPVSTKLNSLKGVTLSVANKIYIKEGAYELLPEIKKDAVSVFNAEIEKVNFSASDAAAALINGWVEQKTNNRIKDLLSADSFSDFTRLVLVNAIYFKGNWKNQFRPQNTQDADFHLDSRKTVKVPMMYQESNFNFGISEGLQAKFLEMPYAGDESSMLIILPDEIEGLNGIIKKLASGYDLMQEVKTMFNTKVQVTLPKFKIETTIDLKALLPKLGIKAIFDENNSGITKLLNNDEKLFVSKAVQKAFIEVNEEGAEAAAATGVQMRKRRSLSPPPRELIVDRPALYCVMAAGTVAFVAAYRGEARPRDEL